MSSTEKTEKHGPSDSDVDELAKVKARKILDEIFLERMALSRESSDIYDTYKRLNKR